tara:strand:- start:684 stop:893 length:210 start_codon:yes stop_codon:yes gene_type:complete
MGTYGADDSTHSSMWFYMRSGVVEAEFNVEINLVGEPVSCFQDRIRESVKGFGIPQRDDLFSFSFLMTD